MRNKHKYPAVPQAFVPVLSRRKRRAGSIAAVPVSMVTLEQIAQLKELYTFRHEQEIVRYLRRYPFLVDVLFEVWQVVQNDFWQGIATALEIEIDHDYPMDHYLFTVILPEDGRFDEAWKCLRELDNNWWLRTKSEKAQGKMCITVE